MYRHKKSLYQDFYQDIDLYGILKAIYISE